MLHAATQLKSIRGTIHGNNRGVLAWDTSGATMDHDSYNCLIKSTTAAILLIKYIHTAYIYESIMIMIVTNIQMSDAI